MGTYHWQWPFVGGTPVSQGLDSEIFDSVRVPHCQTFVREAIQNSLDARLHKSIPVRISFKTYTDRIGPRSSTLSDLMTKRRDCDLYPPIEMEEDQIAWMVVEDTNTFGLRGETDRRTSDFWNYWLNFGISNKDGRGRGGRGIGRVTFLLASRIHTVIGVTRRIGHKEVLGCGMSVLRAKEESNRFRSTHAYLAKDEIDSIYNLYKDQAFINHLIDDYNLQDYRNDTCKSGFSLVIPYPHSELTDDRLLAAAIEDFAPAILNESLVVDVNGRALDKNSIRSMAIDVKGCFRSASLQQNPLRLIDLCEVARKSPEITVTVQDITKRLTSDTYKEDREKIRKQFIESGQVNFALDVPVEKGGETHRSVLKVAIGTGLVGEQPVDAFFREGMCLPDVDSGNPGETDLVVLSDEGELATYLNFCEGKAHLDLLETNEVKDKLRKQGYTNYSPPYEKRFVKRLPNDLRIFVQPDSSEPDASVFERFFAAPRQGAERAKPKPRRPGPVPPIPEPRTPPFLVKELEDGFEVRANTEFKDWPVNVRVEIAYADGSRRPSWSPFDFKLSDLSIELAGASERKNNSNRIICRGCENTFVMTVTGFDTRRELVTSVRAFRNA